MKNITERRILVFEIQTRMDTTRSGRPLWGNREISVPYTGFAGAGPDRDRGGPAGPYRGV